MDMSNVVDRLKPKGVLPLALIVAIASSEILMEKPLSSRIFSLFSPISQAYAISEQKETPQNNERKEPPSEEEIIDAVRKGFGQAKRELFERCRLSPPYHDNLFCKSRGISPNDTGSGFPFVFEGNGDVEATFEKGFEDSVEIARDPAIPYRLSFMYSGGRWHNISGESRLGIEITGRLSPMFHLTIGSTLNPDFVNRLSTLEEGVLVYTHPIDSFMEVNDRIVSLAYENLGISPPRDPPTREGLMLPRVNNFIEAALFRGLYTKDFGSEQRFRVIMVTGKEGFELVHTPEYLMEMAQGLPSTDEGMMSMIARLSPCAEKYQAIVDKVTGWDIFRDIPTHEIVDYVNVWMGKGNVPFRLKLVEIPK